MLANRLKGILPLIISPNQCAFVPGRLISDNILVAYETLHTMNSQLYGKKGYMALKLDMNKANDRVECFIKAMLSKLGFATRWITLILQCITSSSFSFSILECFSSSET